MTAMDVAQVFNVSQETTRFPTWRITSQVPLEDPIHEWFRRKAKEYGAFVVTTRLLRPEQVPIEPFGVFTTKSLGISHTIWAFKSTERAQRFVASHLDAELSTALIVWPRGFSPWERQEFH